MSQKLSISFSNNDLESLRIIMRGLGFTNETKKSFAMLLEAIAEGEISLERKECFKKYTDKSSFPAFNITVKSETLLKVREIAKNLNYVRGNQGSISFLLEGILRGEVTLYPRIQESYSVIVMSEIIVPECLRALDIFLDNELNQVSTAKLRSLSFEPVSSDYSIILLSFYSNSENNTELESRLKKTRDRNIRQTIDAIVTINCYNERLKYYHSNTQSNQSSFYRGGQCGA